MESLLLIIEIKYMAIISIICWNKIETLSVYWNVELDTWDNDISIIVKKLNQVIYKVSWIWRYDTKRVDSTYMKKQVENIE